MQLGSSTRKVFLKIQFTWTVAFGIHERPTYARSSQERSLPQVTKIATGTRTQAPTRITSKDRGIIDVSMAEKLIDAPVMYIRGQYFGLKSLLVFPRKYKNEIKSKK